MTNVAAAYAKWLLGNAVTCRTLACYRKVYGDPALLFAELGFAPNGSDRISEILSPTEVLRLNGRAIGQLASVRQRVEGKQSLRAVDWRIIRYTLHGGRTLRESIERCVDCFEAIDYRCGRMSLKIAGECATVQLDAQHQHKDAVACLIDLHGIANICGLLSALISQPLPLIGIGLDQTPELFNSLELPAPPVPLTLGKGWTGFCFPSAYLDHPVVRTFEEVNERGNYIYWFETWGEEDAPEALSARVRRIALHTLRDTGRLPPFKQVVATVGGSPATLRRRMAAAGISYRGVRDSCRRELALQLLTETQGSIEEITAKLDFCDSDAFRRAFRDWFGISPTAFRAQLAKPAEVSSAKTMGVR